MRQVCWWMRRGRLSRGRWRPAQHSTRSTLTPSRTRKLLGMLVRSLKLTLFFHLSENMNPTIFRIFRFRVVYIQLQGWPLLLFQRLGGQRTHLRPSYRVIDLLFQRFWGQRTSCCTVTNLLVSEVVRSENQFGHSYRVTTPSSSVYVQRTFGISSTEPKVQGSPKKTPVSQKS